MARSKSAISLLLPLISNLTRMAHTSFGSSGPLWKADVRLCQALLVRPRDLRAVLHVAAERPDAVRLMSPLISSMNARYFGSYMSRVSIHAAANPDEPMP